MNCTDLDRYLEAFLDGRLGRARAGLLRRHISGCPACRRRLDALQEFERDLNKRLRAMGQCESVWAGLELHLVSSSNQGLPSIEAAPRALLPAPTMVELPAPSAGTGEAVMPGPIGHGYWAQRTFGLFLLVAAGGTVFEGIKGWIHSTVAPVPAVYAQLDGLKGSFARELRSTDPHAIQLWLTRELGTAVPLPPQPGDFHLIGSHLERLGGEDTGVVTYRRGGSISQVYLRPTRARDQAQAVESLRRDLHGRARTSWTDHDMAYALTSPIAPDQFQPLVRARWSSL